MSTDANDEVSVHPCSPRNTTHLFSMLQVSRGGFARDGPGQADPGDGSLREAGERLRCSLSQYNATIVCLLKSTACLVHQLEYDNIEGMILLSELSRRRIRSIQKLIRVGRNEVVVVMRVDKEKGQWESLSYCLPVL